MKVQFLNGDVAVPFHALNYLAATDANTLRQPKHAELGGLLPNME